MLLVLAAAVHTLEDEPAEAADALLVDGGRVLAVGPRARVRPLAAQARVLDLDTAVLTPGLCDAHSHIVEWALARRQVDLTRAESPQAAASAVAAHAAGTGGEWVRGFGWNPHLWSSPPRRELLDRAVPNRPVALQSHDMHALWLNAAALERAGITAATADPPGGRIERDEAGEPTGVVYETAATLVARAFPRVDDRDAASAVLEAQTELHGLGVTAVHAFEMDTPRLDTLRILERLRAADRLRLRVLQQIPLALLDDALRIGLRSGFGDDWLRIGGIKMFLDGALGSRTAWLREPYEGTHDTGVRVLPEPDFREAVRRAGAGGLSAAVHAIGDAAVDLAVDVLTAAAAARIPHRIEHVQLCSPAALDRLPGSGVTCSMQPAHLITDWRPAERHWGEQRSRRAYAFGSLAGRGATLAFGSDAPVEPVDPRLGMYAATARQDLDGQPEGGWTPAERLPLRAAFEAYTRGPARAAALDGRLGRLAPGALADFVAWKTDPLAATGREILELETMATFVAGELVWSREPLAAEP